MEKTPKSSFYYLHRGRGSTWEGWDRIFKYERVRTSPCFSEYAHKNTDII